MPRRRDTEDEIELTEAELVDDNDASADEDRLPWLEAVEEDGESEGPGFAKLAAALIIGLLAIGLIVGGLFWLGNRNRPGGNGEIIAAPEGDYKVRPDDPGGMNVQGEGDTAIAASEGAQPQGQLDTSRVSETPVERQGAAPVSQSGQPAPAQNQQASAPARPAAPTPARPAPAAGPTVQLGAFSSEASATRAWTALSGRFRYLAPLSHGVVPVQANGRTLYRLRASGPGAVDICRRLQAAGETCAPVG